MNHESLIEMVESFFEGKPDDEMNYCVLVAALFNTFEDLSWKSRRYSEGNLCFDGRWFIVGIDTPAGTYSYHLKNELWDLFRRKELERAKPWDGRTGKDVVRLLSLNNTKFKSDRCILETAFDGSICYFRGQ